MLFDLVWDNNSKILKGVNDHLYNEPSESSNNAIDQEVMLLDRRPHLTMAPILYIASQLSMDKFLDSKHPDISRYSP